MTILEEVAARPEGAGLQDLAAAIGCSAPAALNLARTLVAMGYLRRQEKPVRYVVGEKVGELSRLQSSRSHIGELKRRMATLVERFPGLSVHHCVFKGSEIVIERTLEGGAGGVFREGADYVLPAYTSLASMVHLAFWPDALAAEYIHRHPFDIYGSAYWRSRENFEAALDRIRKDGVYHKSQDDTEGIGIGIPIFTAGRSLRASLTLGWRPPQKKRVDFKAMRDEIARAALEVLAAEAN
jgi:DNA-binding IclR family transcriptional regulator